MEIKKASFDECILAHPGGVAWNDQSKLYFWDLKNPDAPPVEGPEDLRIKLAQIKDKG